MNGDGDAWRAEDAWRGEEELGGGMAGWMAEKGGDRCVVKECEGMVEAGRMNE